MSKLSYSDKEELIDLMQHPGYPALLKLVDELKEAIDADVIKFNTDTGDAHTLLKIKCRSEGAGKLAAALKQRLSSLKTS